MTMTIIKTITIAIIIIITIISIMMIIIIIIIIIEGPGMVKKVKWEGGNKCSGRTFVPSKGKTKSGKRLRN